MNNPDHIFESLETIFLVFLWLKYLNSLMRIRDPGWRQFGSGMEKRRITLVLGLDSASEAASPQLEPGFLIWDSVARHLEPGFCI
jgi:hypothetical protein